MTVAAETVSLNIIYEGLLLTVLPGENDETVAFSKKTYPTQD